MLESHTQEANEEVQSAFLNEATLVSQSASIFDSTSFFDRVSFRYVHPLLTLGAKGAIKESDIPNVRQRSILS